MERAIHPVAQVTSEKQTNSCALSKSLTQLHYADDALIYQRSKFQYIFPNNIYGLVFKSVIDRCRTMCGWTSPDTTPICLHWRWKTLSVWVCSTKWTRSRTRGSNTTASWRMAVSTSTVASVQLTHMVRKKFFSWLTFRQPVFIRKPVRMCDFSNCFFLCCFCEGLSDIWTDTLLAVIDFCRSMLSFATQNVHLLF